LNNKSSLSQKALWKKPLKTKEIIGKVNQKQAFFEVIKEVQHLISSKDKLCYAA